MSERTAQALPRAGDRYRDLFDLAGGGMFETALDGRPITVNPALARTLGYDSPEDFLSHVQNISELYLDPAQRVAMVDAVRRDGVVRGFEIQQRRKDGSPVWVSVTAHYRKDTGGAPLMVGFVVDITERRRVDEAVRASEERYRSVVAAMADGIVLHDVDGVIEECNASAEAILGLTRDQMMGRIWLDPRLSAIHEDGSPFPGDTHPSVATLRTGKPCSNVIMGVHRPDGTLTWISINTQPLVRVGETTPYAVVASFADISDRKRAEAALRASEAATRGSLDAMLDPCFICSSIRDASGAIVDFRVDFANRAAGTYMGRAPEMLVGKAIPEQMPSLRGRPFIDIVRQVVESGQGWSEDAVEFALPGRDGDEIHGMVDFQVVQFDNWFFVVWRDVTERERTLAALRASELHARELVEYSADGILISGPDERYMEANPAMCRMLGYSREELLRMHAGDLTAGDDPVGNVAMHERLAEPAAEAGILTERRYRRSDGTSVPVEVRFTMLSGGRRQRNVRDISERLAGEADEAREARIRVALSEGLQRVAVEATVEEAAQAMCDVLSTLPGVDFTGVDAFLGEGEGVTVAGTVPAGFLSHPGGALPPDWARHLQARAAQGPWSEYATVAEPFGLWGQAAVTVGLRAVAFGPIVHGDHVDGVLAIGTADESFAKTLVERMPGVVAFSATSSGLLAERLHARRREAELRRSMASVLLVAAFHPVFQPIVDLESREVVGYEALTRFDSGQRPDLCFADAWSAGLGPELEIATLEAAVAASQELPAGRWLSLNVSPRLLADLERLRRVLLGAGRPLAIEITEHEIIADYGAVREAIHALGNDVRLAVDDAGAGIANFGHIVELRPDLVKLDISLVRDVNANLGRQAMVVGMSRFSRTAGCRLVAEGVETEAEAAALRGLGVEFGQGYLFGRPEPVEVWATAKTKDRDARPRNVPPSRPATPTTLPEPVSQG